MSTGFKLDFRTGETTHTACYYISMGENGIVCDGGKQVFTDNKTVEICSLVYFGGLSGNDRGLSRIFAPAVCVLT